MAASNDPRIARAYLEELCERLDRKQPLARPRKAWWKVAVPVGLSLGMAACGGTVEESSGGGGNSDGGTEMCTDDVDNDGDGKIDCDDSDCANHSMCQGALYAGPPDSGSFGSGLRVRAATRDQGLRTPDLARRGI